MIGLLTLAITLPIIGAMVLMAIPNRDGEKDGLIRWLALAISLLAFAVSLVLWAGFDTSPSAPAFQFVERASWIPQFGIEYTSASTVSA